MLPEPPVALTGGCTVIFENTLYSYSAAGFQSLKLEKGTAWKKLPSGKSVERAVCVGSTPKDHSTAGLFIVGGESGETNYTGLQKFTYSTGEWETVTPQVPVTKNRVYHSATYINSTESLLVYAGSTDGNPELSEQTFTIATSEPYQVLAYESDLSPPGVAPLLLPWSETQVALIGGNSWNTRIVLFDTTAIGADGGPGSWVDSGITLAEPLPKNTTVVRGIVIQGDDGSKQLYTFDPSTSPNTVNRIVLAGANGAPMILAAPVKPGPESNGKERDGMAPVGVRDLLASNWPPYDSTHVPTSIRTDYSIASDPNGLVVISGGNANDVLGIFNAKANSWEDAMVVLGGGSLSVQANPTVPLPETPSTSATQGAMSATESAATSAAASTTTPPPAVAPATTKHGLTSSEVVGITLSSIFGVIALFTLIFILMQYRRPKKSHAEMGHTRKATGAPDHEALPQVPNAPFMGHVYHGSQSSFSSMAIFLGKTPKPTQQGSSDTLQNRDIKQMISRPQPQTCTQPAFLAVSEKDPVLPAPAQSSLRPRQTVDSFSAPRRSSGWNRYWSGGSASILGLGSKSRRETQFSDASSRYSDTYRLTQDSANVPPLHVLSEGRPSFQQVSSGSPTVSQFSPTTHEGLSGKIERPVSPESTTSSSSTPHSTEETWEYATTIKSWGVVRAPSSVYVSGTVSDDSGRTGRASTTVNRGISQQPQLAVASVSSDMSWLNLGDSSSNSFVSKDQPSS